MRAAVPLNAVLASDDGSSFVPSISPTSSPTSAPTSFFQSLLNDADLSSAKNLSSTMIGVIVGVCLVVLLLAGAFYIYKKKRAGADSSAGYNTSNSANYA